MGARERYRRVLAAPHVGGLWAASVLGRLPIGINGLAIVLAMRHETGSFGAAGIAAGAYAASLGLTTPYQGRLIDRYGPRAILPPMVIAHAVLLAAFVALLGTAPIWVLVALAALCAIGLPPWSSVMRSMWPRLLGEEELITTAFALDAAIVESVFILGPLIVALLLVFTAAKVALLISATMVVVGTFALVASPAIKSWVREGPHGAGIFGALRSPGLLTVFLATMPVGFAFGAMEIALPAFAAHQGHPSQSGLLISMWGVGSTAGALFYGARPWKRPLSHRWLVFTTLMAVGSALPLAAGSTATMIALLIPCGVFIAPAIASGSQLMGILAPPGMSTEAYSWGPTAIVVGAAAGNAVAGGLVEAVNWRAAVGAALLAGTAGALVGYARRRTLVLPVAVA
ncbi:MAG: transporter [Solirubrobacterales bacterium]|nr:transporter [Solirubrobacterales bacterium]